MGRVRTHLPALVTVGLPLALALPMALRGHVPWFMDVWMQFYPIRLMAAQQVAEGWAPLWNPAYYAGVPLLANPQWGLLNPLLWPFLLWPSGFTYSLVCHVIPHAILAGGGYWLGRSLFKARSAAAAVGLTLALGGWTWAHYPFGAYLQVVCWAPWFMACQWRHARGEPGRWLLAAGMLWALQLLAGAPQAVFHCGQAYLVLACCLAAIHRGWRPIVFLVAAVGWALLLSAAQILPTVDFLRHTVRGGALELETLRGGALGLFGDGSLWNALVGGNVFDPAQGEDAESTVFIGWIALMLVALNLLPPRVNESTSQRDNSPLWPFALIVLLAFLWSWSALAPLLHPWMPGYASFHNPKRALLAAHLGLAVLAGGGMATLLAHSTDKRSEPFLPTAALFMLVASMLWFAFLHIDRATREPPAENETAASLRALATVGDLPARVAARDRGLGYSYHFRRGRIGEMLFPNLPGVQGALDAQGYDPAIPIRTRLFFDVLNRGFISVYPRQLALIRNWESPLVDLLAVRVVETPGWRTPRVFEGMEPSLDDEALDARFPSTRELPPLLSATAEGEPVGHVRRLSVSAQPRLVHRPRVVYQPDVVSAAQALAMLGERVRSVAVIEDADLPPGERAAGLESDLTLHAAEETPTRLTYEIEAPVGWIVLRDQILPGWKARIDGEPVPVLAADVLFRAVEWPDGRHTLEFAYRPAVFRVGWMLSLVGLAAWLALFISSRRRMLHE